MKKAAENTTTTVKKAVSVAKAPAVSKAAVAPKAKAAAKVDVASPAPAKPAKSVVKPATPTLVASPSKAGAPAKTADAKPIPKSAGKAAAPAPAPALAKSVNKPVAAPAAKKPADAPKPLAAPPVAVATAVAAKQPVVQVGKSAAAAALHPQAAVVPAAPTRRGGRKSSQAALPTPQPLPSHSPDAAKATFSHISERVMTLPVQSPVRKDPKLANNWKNKSVDLLLDEEVLAMPDAEYMNDTQMAFFRLKLVRLKDGILANAGETTEHLREDTVVVPDPADRATIEEEHALELRTRDRERKLLKKIEQSIARIDSGDYGYCDETGEPIGVGRLIARPTASLSLEAQQRRELKQKMFGD